MKTAMPQSDFRNGKSRKGGIDQRFPNEFPTFKNAEERDAGLINSPKDRSAAQQHIRVSGILSALQPDSRAWLLVLAPNGGAAHRTLCFY